MLVFALATTTIILNAMIACTRLALFAAIGLPLLLGSACHTTARNVFHFSAPSTNVNTAEALHSAATSATRQIEQFFGHPFPKKFDIFVLADRAALDRSLPVEWGIAPTQCWMVAAGVSDRLWILSPDVWREQACDHDPENAKHVRDIVAHELVHVFHGQMNPSGDFSAVENIDWFVEGLATYVSGQLEEQHLLSAEDALKAHAEPKQLSDAWKGKYRYGVSGSLVRYLDRQVGHVKLNQMLRATNQVELLAIAGMSESELLDKWRRSVAEKPATSD
jgi:hypothetical protein